ncbi:TraU family protein [Candidatus Velamenicoccus archaeovorus]|uniref:TraU family protein n=1 Tax=Velamenicoccus archaeovorus TaxID=1930593 RepID=UPI0013E8F505|nr:TraU family protein [Candidatus Velamenicoccus archaeovorus]
MVLLLVLCFVCGRAYALELSDIPGMIDWSCLDLKVIGTCVGPFGIPGIVIMYWEPALLIETVKQPGDTIIGSLKPEFQNLTAQAVKNFAKSIAGSSILASSGSGSSKIEETNLQFNEAHVYAFPFGDEIMMSLGMTCPDKLPTGFFIKYLSELDSLEWRIGVTEVLNPKSMASAASGPACAAISGFMEDLCMGYWGATYPRRGFFTHQSQVVGSAAAAIRAVSIASALNVPGHVVLETTGFVPSFGNDKLQMIYPVVSGCIKIGQNPALWESGKLSANGKYLWVYWRRRICCVY